MRTKLPMGWCDLLVGLFLVLLIGSAAISGITEAQETANRAKCASNLHQLGLAILLYQGDNQQSYPRTMRDKSEEPIPVWGTPYQTNLKLGPQEKTNPFDGGKAAPATNDVTASLFLLLREEQLTAGVFVCPSTLLQPWDLGGGNNTAQNWTNWDGNLGLRKHLSYSFQNPFISPEAIDRGYQIKNPDSTFAVLADMNPGTDAVTTVTPDSPADAIHNANSFNHQGLGQNVLYGDGHAEWSNTPFAGTDHDNIYTAAGPEIKTDERTKAVILASPVSLTDSILLPTAADIGFKSKPTVEENPLTADQRGKLQESIEGNYTAFINGAETTMTMDDKTIQYKLAGDSYTYNYQAIGGRGSTLVITISLINTNKRQRATLELNDGELTISSVQDLQLDYGWKKKPTAK